MTSRILLSAVLVGALARRDRRDDGRLFGVATLRDTDRGKSRTWTVFVNDVELIERLEKLKDGEPVAIAGPFSVTADGDRLVHRISADEIIGARKERKKRSKNDACTAADPEDAPKDDAEGRPFDDGLTF